MINFDIWNWIIPISLGLTIMICLWDDYTLRK